jgi:hypothetical protein
LRSRPCSAKTVAPLWRPCTGLTPATPALRSRAGPLPDPGKRGYPPYLSQFSRSRRYPECVTLLSRIAPLLNSSDRRAASGTDLSNEHTRIAGTYPSYLWLRVLDASRALLAEPTDEGRYVNAEHVQVVPAFLDD